MRPHGQEGSEPLTMTTTPGAQTGVWNFRSHVTDCSWHPRSQLPGPFPQTRERHLRLKVRVAGPPICAIPAGPSADPGGVKAKSWQNTLGLNLKLLRPPPHLVQPVALLLRPVWDAREAWRLSATLTSR